MCGFAGILRPGPTGANELLADVTRMTRSLKHRGPDDEGFWMDASAGVALGFRRLAIIDLSALGHQPMSSSSGRFTMVFNGEVYNYVELRRELEAIGYRFRGGSDTEVMLAAFEAWGIPGATCRFVGMFAVALWDHQQRRLHLIRDRLGIKPLYVYQKSGTLLFGSELKALMALPELDRTLDADALGAYLRYLYVPAPATIFKHARKLLPGHILTIDRMDRPLPESVPFWSAERVANQGAASRFLRPDEELIEDAERVLKEAVALRMRADVPVGAFLSGGIDSSTVVALMQASSSRRVKTYTIGFSEGDYDEAEHAARIAAHLGTDHTEARLTQKDALAIVPELPTLFDEPLADPSQIPTWLVSHLARREVTVALSGDGGDEIFGGYNRYTYGRGLLPSLLRVPAGARNVIGRRMLGVSTDNWNRIYRTVSPVMPSRLRQRLPGEKVHKMGALMAGNDLAHMYRSLVSAWQAPEALLANGAYREGRLEEIMTRGSDRLGVLDRMMLADQLTYLPDDLLAKVDRASMAVSLEVRVPILDHRVVEFAWRLSPDERIRRGKGKWLLREVLKRHVPAEMFERPKMGFSVPIANWLRGELRPWAEELLSAERLGESGTLRAEPVRGAWQHFLAGHDSAAMGIWAVLMFQAWHEQWIGPNAVTAPALTEMPDPAAVAVAC